jgi:hypothetical protein
VYTTIIQEFKGLDHKDRFFIDKQGGTIAHPIWDELAGKFFLVAQ